MDKAYAIVEEIGGLKELEDSADPIRTQQLRKDHEVLVSQVEPILTSAQCNFCFTSDEYQELMVKFMTETKPAFPESVREEIQSLLLHEKNKKVFMGHIQEYYGALFSSVVAMSKNLLAAVIAFRSHQDYNRCLKEESMQSKFGDIFHPRCKRFHEWLG